MPRRRVLLVVGRTLSRLDALLARAVKVGWDDAVESPPFVINTRSCLIFDLLWHSTTHAWGSKVESCL